MLVVMMLSTFWNLVYAVGIGLVFASLMFMKKIGDLTAQRSEVRPLHREKAWADEQNLPAHFGESIIIKHVMGPLFFGTTASFRQLALQIPKTADTVILRLGRMDYMDQTGLYAMEELLQELLANEVTVLLEDVLEQPRYMMERVDIIPDLIPEDQIFPDLKECLGWIRLNDPRANASNPAGKRGGGNPGDTFKK